jgi:cyclic pyranopterin phosphate synthase
LTAVTVAALTIFDMGKAVDPAMVIGPVQVEFKLKDNQLSFDRSKINGPD